MSCHRSERQTGSRHQTEMSTNSADAIESALTRANADDAPVNLGKVSETTAHGNASPRPPGRDLSLHATGDSTHCVMQQAHHGLTKAPVDTDAGPGMDAPVALTPDMTARLRRHETMPGSFPAPLQTLQTAASSVRQWSAVVRIHGWARIADAKDAGVGPMRPSQESEFPPAALQRPLTTTGAVGEALTRCSIALHAKAEEMPERPAGMCRLAPALLRTHPTFIDTSWSCGAAGSTPSIWGASSSID